MCSASYPSPVPIRSHLFSVAMTVRFLVASAALLVAPAALAAGPGSTPDWASPQAAPARSAGAEAVMAPPTPPPAPQPVPVDGGLTLLAIAGAGYAAKKLRARASA